MNRRSILLFLSLALTGCSGSQVRKPEVKTRNCAKTVQVFLNPDSEKQLRDARLDIAYVLELVNLNLAVQGIDLRYDLKTLKIRKWNYKMKDFPIKDRLSDIRMVLLKYSEKNYKSARADSDIRIFITGDLSANVGQVAKISRNFWKFRSNGRGDMLVGNLNDFDNSVGARDSYISALATTILHEQGHLFGLRHVNKKGTLMYKEDSTGKILFLDEDSKSRLKKILANQKKCSAP